MQLLPTPAFTDHLHFLTSLSQLTGTHHIDELIFIFLGRIGRKNGLLVQHVKQTRIVILMHGLLPEATLAPRSSSDFGETYERLHDLRNQAPTHLQAFEDATVAHVPPQKNYQILLHLLRLPRHLNARRHILCLFHSSSKLHVSVIVHHSQVSIHQHFLNGRSKNHMTTCILAEALLLFIRFNGPQFRTPTCVAGFIPRSANRIHTVAGTKLLHDTHACKEATRLLGKRYRIGLEHVHHRPSHSAEIDLHEIKRHKT